MKIQTSTAIILEIGLFLIIGLGLLIWMVELEGVVFSISSYVQYSSTQVLFKFFILTTAIGVYRNEILKPSFFPSLGLGLFDSVKNFELMSTLHDISAVTFFVMVTASMVITKRSRGFGIALMASFPLYFITGMFVGEIISIFIIYSYMIWKIIKIQKINIKWSSWISKE